MGRLKRNFSPNSHHERVTKYIDFHQYIRAFANGKIDTLIITGPPGASKSETIRKAIQDTETLYCEGGQITPLQFYIDCYRACDKPIIIDDAEQIMSSKIGRSLVRALTDTRVLKTMQYRSSTKILSEEGIPNSFDTTSRVCYISNHWLTATQEASALEDRGLLVWFEPPAKEIHLYVKDWFHDQEIFDYIGSMLHLIDKPSCRLYKTAATMKNAGMDWKKHVESKCADSNHQLVINLQNDPTCHAELDREKKFMEITGLSRPTYYNYKKRLKENDQIENRKFKQERLPADLKVKGTAPQPFIREPEPQPEMENAI